ncbi:MAG: T9SS type A sorting domain-containing protein [Bacteroidota bacterium]|nr:T9SS type A sorting domain-containing protein [Bacteroidota bacterium]
MKASLFFFFYVFFVSQATFAQSFTLEPSDKVSKFLTIGEGGDLEIKIHNNTQTDLVLEWEKLSNTFHSDWDYSLCDFGNCYIGIPDYAVSSPIPIDGYGFFKISIYLEETAGTGQVSILVYESGKRSEGDTLTFEVNSMNVSIGEENNLLTHSVYPNPASEALHFNFGSALISGTLSLSDMSGREVTSTLLTNQSDFTLDVSNYTQGIYLLQFVNTNGATSTRRVVIAR